MRIRPAFTHTLLSVALLSCGDDGPPAPTIEYELFDITHELDEATLAAFDSTTEDQSTLIFSSSTPLLDSLVEGEILLSGSSDEIPMGLLRRVRSIDRTGTGVSIQTDPTTVFHAFRRLNLDVTTPVGLDSPMRIPPPPPIGPGSVTSPLTFDRTLGLGLRDEPIELFDGDLNEDTLEDRVAGTGTLYAEVEIHFWLSFDWEDLTPTQAASELGDLLESLGDLLTGDVPSLAELLHLRTGITMEGTIEAGMQLEGRSSRHYVQEIPLGTVPLGVVPVGPLVFLPALSLDAQFSGEVSGSMSLAFSLEADAKLGFELDEEDLTPILEGPTFTQESTSPTVTASAGLHGELALSLRFPLMGTVGPYVGLAASLDAGVDRARDPCFQLHAGLRGTSGAWIGLFGTTIASVSGPSIDIGDPRLLASGECAPLPDPPITDALITPWSRSYGESAWSTGDDDDFTTLSRAHDDRLLLTSSTGRMALKVDESGTPIWAKTFDQPDRVFSSLMPSLAVPTLDAGVLVATREGVLVKLDLAGDYHWAAQLETDNLEEGYFRSGELIGESVWLTGVHRGEDAEQQALVVLVGPDGYPEVTWTWGQPDYDETIRHVLALEDGVIIVGDAQTPSFSDRRSFIMEVGFDGTIRWAKNVEGCDPSTEPTLATAIQTGEGDLVFGGWHYSAPTRAILFRIPRDGNVTAPSWMTETTTPALLGLLPRSIHQMQTGELRVVGRLARTGGDDAVFVAATDSIGRFNWLRWYGGDRNQGPPTATLTAQGGLLVATTSTTVELPPGGFWMFEVPNPNGEITFRPESEATSESMSSDSVAGCLSLTPAEVSTFPYPIGVTSVHVDVSDGDPTVSVQSL